MMCRFLLLFFGLLVGWLANGLPTSAASAEPKRRPNILFVFADDHSTAAIGAYGSQINVTPNIDRLAREGMLFRNSFVTNSICGPSRAVILTGKYSHLNGFLRNNQRFDGSQPTFPKLLREAGYQTALIGKWHLKSRPTGFDYWQILYGQGRYYNPTMNDNGKKRRYAGYTTDIITDLTLDWLRNKRDRARPFVLMYQHKAPHAPWAPGPDQLTLYDNITIPEPDTLFDDYSGRGSPAKQQTMSIARNMTRRHLKLEPPAQRR